MKQTIIILVILFPLFVYSQHYERAFKKIDAHARNVPSAITKDPNKLVDYLIAPCKNDWQKTRTIFVWVAENIAYDTQSYKNNTVTYEKCKPINVFRSRKGVCSGYANLFEYLCQLAELECYDISGYAKGAGHYAGEKYNETNHAWNICVIDGALHLFDVTWAAGYVNYYNFENNFNDFWWDTPPELFVTTHYAIPSKYNNLKNPVSKSQFEQMSIIDQFNSNHSHKINKINVQAGAANVFSNIDNLANGHYQAILHLGVLKGEKGYGQNFYGMFSSLDLGIGFPICIETGFIMRRFFRLSAGFQYGPDTKKNARTYQLVPSLTTGFRINLSNIFIDLNLNAYGNYQNPETRFITAIGFSF